MKPKTIGPGALVVAALLSGCSSVHTQPAWESIKDKTAALSNNLRQSNQNPQRSGTSLLATPLHGALSRQPSTDGQTPEWPKVVITNLKIPAEQLDLGRTLTLRPDECIHFDAVLWRSAQESQRFDDIHLCANELPKQSNNFVLTWKSFSIAGDTTGQVRTEGPTPPSMKLPSDPVVDQWLMSQFGLYYLGSLLTLVGYDPDFTPDSRRFWVKDLSQ